MASCKFEVEVTGCYSKFTWLAAMVHSAESMICSLVDILLGGMASSFTMFHPRFLIQYMERVPSLKSYPVECYYWNG